jgi:hypothetical protein
MEDLDYMLIVEYIYPLNNIEVLVLNKYHVHESIEEDHSNKIMVVDDPLNKFHDLLFDIDRDVMLSIQCLHHRSLEKENISIENNDDVILP